MISIIIPVYNVAAVLKHSVESVLRQTDCDREVILVDDGSTDGSGDICDSYSHLSDVKVIHKMNGGLSSARNAGIEAAGGDYFLFLDSDDYLRDGTLSHLDALAKNYPDTDFIQFRYKEVADYLDKENADRVKNLEYVDSKRQLFERMLDLGGIGASACTKLISRKALGDLRFTEGIIHEDEDFTIQIIDKCNSALYIDNELYMYVWREGSIITQKYTSKRLDIIPVLNKQIAILEHNGFNDLANRVRKKLIMSMCIYYVQARTAHAQVDVTKITTEAKRLAPSVKNWRGGKFEKIAAALYLHLPVLQLYYWYKKLH